MPATLVRPKVSFKRKKDKKLTIIKSKPTNTGYNLLRSPLDNKESQMRDALPYKINPKIIETFVTNLGNREISKENVPI